jgi:hypothetical protein
LTVDRCLSNAVGISRKGESGVPGSVDDVRRHAEPVTFSHFAGHGFKYGIGNICARLTLRHTRRRASTTTATSRGARFECLGMHSPERSSTRQPSGATVMSCSEQRPCICACEVMRRCFSHSSDTVRLSLDAVCRGFRYLGPCLCCRTYIDRTPVIATTSRKPRVNAVCFV